MKKVLTVFMVFFLLIMSVPKANAADDITGHLFETEMQSLIAKGILKGYEPGIYKPDASITRAEFAAMIVRALELEPVQSAEFSVAASAEPLYKDVSPIDWYYSTIDAAAKNGIVKGYPDGTFKPSELISRQEMAVMAFRAIDSKGIYSSPANITFSDVDKIGVDYLDAIKRLVSLKIMQGNADQTFGPLAKSTRGQTAAVIYRMLNVIDSTVNNGYSIVEFSQDRTPKKLKHFADFSTAKNNLANGQAIMQGNSIVYIQSGLAVSNQFTIIYNGTNFVGSGRTYVSSGTEFKYLDASTDWVKISIGNQVGYVDPANVNLVPTSLIVDQSSYKRVGNELYHTIYNPIAKTSSSILIGKAPSFMIEGTKYYSWDGVTYTDVNGNILGEGNIYFNRADLKTQTNYSGADLDKYLIDQYPDTYKTKVPNSPLAGLGSFFKEMETRYGVNALYLMSHAIHESAWGTSAIAQDKHNLFGYGAADADPYTAAYTYNSFEESIEDAARKISTNYLASNGMYFNGSLLGNKGIGMNVKYASDPFWGEKIAGHMYRADKYLGGLDIE